MPYPESAYRACIAANKNLASYRNGTPVPSFIPPYSALSVPRPGSIFGANVTPIENSVMYGNPQQQQLPGNRASFGILRNNRAQGNASPGSVLFLWKLLSDFILRSLSTFINVILGLFCDFWHFIISRLSTDVNG